MSNKLSHSSVNMFSDCAKKWQLHYIEKLRGTTQSAALLFGTAIDKAVENLVLNKDLPLAKLVFYTFWSDQEINGVKTKLETCPDIVYAKNDMDLELIENVIDRDKLLGIDALSIKKDGVGFENLPVEQKIELNKINWLIAQKRGMLMLEVVNEQILPKIKKVLSTQEKIDLTNDSGDSVVGYVDLVAEYDDYDVPIVFDFKTSSRPYEEDSVKTSPQLALYSHALAEKYNTKKAGFIVLSKAIQKNRKKICKKCGNDGSGARHKTCNAEVERYGDGKKERCNGEWIETIDPKCKIDVIIDDIPDQLEDIVLENMDNTNKMIHGGIFTRNLNACKKPYGLCVYYKLCHENKMDGLVKIETKTS